MLAEVDLPDEQTPLLPNYGQHNQYLVNDSPQQLIPQVDEPWVRNWGEVDEEIPQTNNTETSRSVIKSLTVLVFGNFISSLNIFSWIYNRYFKVHSTHTYVVVSLWLFDLCINLFTHPQYVHIKFLNTTVWGPTGLLLAIYMNGVKAEITRNYKVMIPREWFQFFFIVTSIAIVHICVHPALALGVSNWTILCFVFGLVVYSMFLMAMAEDFSRPFVGFMVVLGSFYAYCSIVAIINSTNLTPLTTEMKGFFLLTSFFYKFVWLEEIISITLLTRLQFENLEPVIVSQPTPEVDLSQLDLNNPYQDVLDEEFTVQDPNTGSTGDTWTEAMSIVQEIYGEIPPPLQWLTPTWQDGIENCG